MEQKRDFRAEIKEVKQQYMAGAISYAEAVYKLRPVLMEMNKRMKKLCKEHGIRFKPLTFSYVFR
jgi:hypothetical protein